MIGTMSRGRPPTSALVLAVLMLGACSSSKTEVTPPTISVSIGQQLIDLKKAKDSGAISESEYQAQVRRVIDSVK
jgi:uncharacterized protein YcfL